MAADNWWKDYPWRMVQTNLREIDMADINAEDYARDLKEYGATLVTINAGGIIASYKTKLPFQTQSEYLTGDSLEKIIEACHAQGIKVIARCDFAKVSEALYQQHPEWAYRTAEGEPIIWNGFVQTCYNSEYQRELVPEIVKEIFTNFDFDGLFCNMSGAVVVDYNVKIYPPCHCEACRKTYEEALGSPIPDRDDPRLPGYLKYAGMRSKAVAEGKKRIYDTVKAIRPGIAVNGYDYQRTESNQEASQAWHAWVYQSASNARRIAGPSFAGVADSASTDFLGFQYRHSSASPSLLELRQWQNLAHASSTSLFIMGTLANHKDRTGIRASQKAFKFFEAHEELYRGLRSGNRALLVNKPIMAREDEEVSGFVELLSELHVPFDEIGLAALTEEVLAEKDLVILPDAASIPADKIELLDRFVESGGKLLASGATGTVGADRRPAETQQLACLGIGKITLRESGLKSSLLDIREADAEMLSYSTAQGLGYVVPGDTLLGGEVKDAAKTDTALAWIPEQPYGPPEIAYPKEFTDQPGLYRTRYGQGLGVWAPFKLGSFYHKLRHANSYIFARDLIYSVLGMHEMAPDLSPMVEVSISRKDGEEIIHLLNASGHFGNAYFEPVPMADVEVVLPEKLPENAQVEALYQGEARLVRGQDGVPDKICLDWLGSFEAIRIHC